MILEEELEWENWKVRMKICNNILVIKDLK